MPKVSKQMQYTAGGLVVAAIVIHFATNSPDGAPVKHKPHVNFGSTVTAQTDDSGITPADYTAHFARYPGGSRNPFLPVVASTTALGGTTGASTSWALTGITTIDGVTTALVENSATGDSVFLKTGDQWNGMRVDSIGSQSATFVDSSGKITQLSFPLTATDTDSSDRTPNTPAAQPNMPFPVSGTVPTGGIPPFPVTGVAPLRPAQQN